MSEPSSIEQGFINLNFFSKISLVNSTKIKASLKKKKKKKKRYRGLKDHKHSSFVINQLLKPICLTAISEFP